jgi:hypothetical protein
MPLPCGNTDLWVLLGNDKKARQARGSEPILTVMIDGTGVSGTARVARPVPVSSGTGRAVVRWNNQDHSPLAELNSVILRFAIPPGIILFAFGFTGMSNSSQL